MKKKKSNLLLLAFHFTKSEEINITLFKKEKEIAVSAFFSNVYCINIYCINSFEHNCSTLWQQKPTVVVKYEILQHTILLELTDVSVFC